jgi:hypothetical protein
VIEGAFQFIGIDFVHVQGGELVKEREVGHLDQAEVRKKKYCPKQRQRICRYQRNFLRR